MKSTNTVAKVLKIYGIINGVASVIFAIILYNNLPGNFDYLWIVALSAGIVASFLVYAFGEVVQILHDIRENTQNVTFKEIDPAFHSAKSLTKVEDDEIPEI